MKHKIAAEVVLCAACVEGANMLDGHKGKHELTLSVRDRTRWQPSEKWRKEPHHSPEIRNFDKTPKFKRFKLLDQPDLSSPLYLSFLATVVHHRTHKRVAQHVPVWLCRGA
jgi:hypothetical protein